ncbi:hypothetical protein [Streptococcus bouchesdurhonensis]|uniref:hypothetical protein n=1 Tax=Streptococcus bouchesdurhonensis TaxID=2954240 RepID=UPI0021C43185|nr:hypothetical protein [Streptococcus bouchesdurhonensis]
MATPEQPSESKPAEDSMATPEQPSESKPAEDSMATPDGSMGTGFLFSKLFILLPQQ